MSNAQSACVLGRTMMEKTNFWETEPSAADLLHHPHRATPPFNLSGQTAAAFLNTKLEAFGKSTRK